MRAADTYEEFYALVKRAMKPYSTLPLLAAIEQAEESGISGDQTETTT
jgi:hypothetical protein